MNDTINIPLSETGKYAGKYTAIVDAIDADLNQFKWQVNIFSDTRQYAQRSKWGKLKSKIFQMHRVILARKLERDELLPTEQVDHINGNGLDNRRENLRLATNSQNQHNQKKMRSNTSGYKGVSFDKKSGRWYARICINYKKIYLGMFDTPELAYEAYCQKAKELHGEYANFGQE